MTGITTHLLDIGTGRPLAGVQVELYDVATDPPTLLNKTTTNADGRTNAPMLPAASARTGQFELRFHVGEYFKSAEALSDIVPVRFAVFDAAQGKLPGEIVYPPSTVLSEHTLVVVDRNVAPEDRALIDALVEFLWSEPAQRGFVRRGFRSVDERLNGANPAFGTIQDPFRVADFGGWDRVKKEIVDGIWRDRVMKEVGK